MTRTAHVPARELVFESDILGEVARLGLKLLTETLLIYAKFLFVAIAGSLISGAEVSEPRRRMVRCFALNDPLPWCVPRRPGDT